MIGKVIHRRWHIDAIRWHIDAIRWHIDANGFLEAAWH